MSLHETDLVERLQALARELEMPSAPVADDVWRGRRRVRRTRGLLAGAAAAAVVVVLGVAAVLGGPGRQESDPVVPAYPPGIVVGAVPVWWDANGLHRGDVVEQTPVPIASLDGYFGDGALALVRTGAVYQDPATTDVWFHPWGGQPRIVGHHSSWGPGGDPEGDIAAWFDRGELVVYDTRAAREVSRSRELLGVTGTSGDHNPAGNTFLQVSAERVVWRANPTDAQSLFIHDLRKGTTAEVEMPDPMAEYTLDVHDQIEVHDEDWSELVLTVPGRADERYPGMEGRARLSASGSYALTVEDTKARHAAAIIDTRTGELWRVPVNTYPWIAWSYGDIALVGTDDALFACDAGRQSCERLPAEQPVLLPTS